MRTKDQIIADSIVEGYKLIATGNGSYDEAVAFWRSQGYDVRYWYMTNPRSKNIEERTYHVYGLLKSTKKSQKVDSELVPMPGIEKLEELKREYIDYSKMTVKELRVVCQEKKIKGYGKMNKQKIIDILKNEEAC